MDGEIWDEERWESFLKENDKRIERYMALLFRFMSENPPAGDDGSPARKAWERDLREYLLSNGISPDDALPRMLSGSWSEEDEEDDLSLGPGSSFLDVAESDDAVHDIRNLPAYFGAHQLTTRVLKWSNMLPGRVKDSNFVQFCSYVTQIPANLAKGHGIGYEIEMLGGNIACAKRALAAANAALELLRDLKSAAYMEREFYRSLYEECFELRNEIGLYVLDLRSRFDLGID